MGNARSGPQKAGSPVTVYHNIWSTEHTHCVIWYGFSEFIEPVNNIGYIVKGLHCTIWYDSMNSVNVHGLALHRCRGLKWPAADTYQFIAQWVCIHPCRWQCILAMTPHASLPMTAHASLPMTGHRCQWGYMLRCRWLGSTHCTV